MVYAGNKSDLKLTIDWLSNSYSVRKLGKTDYVKISAATSTDFCNLFTGPTK